MLFLSATLAAPAQAGDVVIYDGPGVCEGCAEALIAPAKAAGLSPRLSGPEILRADRLSGVDMLLIGGGEDAGDIAGGMGRAGLAALRDWVGAGGRYLGICAGAYLAGEVLDDQGNVPGLALFAGDAMPYSPYQGRVENVEWRGVSWPFYTQDAPSFDLEPGFSGQVLARYGNGAVAALMVDYGAGRVVLSGPHPEATQDWLADDGIVAQRLAPPEVARDLIGLLAD